MGRMYRVKKENKWLPEAFYREHLEHFPIPTVDIVVTDARSRVLLVKRNQNNLNWKGFWATPGGRLYRNERSRLGATRVLKRETGLDVAPSRFKFCGYSEIVTPKEHGITLVFGVKTTEESVRPDATSSTVRWFNPRNLPRSLRPEYRDMIRIGGVDLNY